MRIRNGALLVMCLASALALSACGGSDEESGEDPKIRLLNLSAGYTALDLMTKPELLRAAQTEFAASSAGRKYVTPLPEGTVPH